MVERPAKHGKHEVDVSIDVHPHHPVDMHPLLLDKLNTMHEDIIQVKDDVRVLQEDFIRRKMVYKMALAIVGSAIAFAAWVSDHLHQLRIWTGI